jgi:hypothetical protein
MVMKVIILLLSLCAVQAAAQTDTLTKLEDAAGYIYQDAFTHTDDDDRFLNSAEVYTEFIEMMMHYPLLLVDPTRFSLNSIPTLTDIDINRFLSNYKSNSRDVERTLKRSMLTRYLVTRKSYNIPLVDVRSRISIDPGAAGGEEYIENTYQGSPVKLYNRLLINTDDVRFAMLQAKSAGEPLFFDQVSLHLELARPYIVAEDIQIRSLVFGDYSLSFGEGLAMQSGVLQMKSRDAIVPASRRMSGLHSYLSSSAYRYFRGVTSTIDVGSFSITPFYSERPVDATLTDSGTVSSVSYSGYHRTESELSRRNSIDQESFGAHAAFDLLRGEQSYMNISAIGYKTSYSKPLVSSDTISTKFIGQDLSMYSFASVYATTSFSVRGEFARSTSDAANASAVVLSGMALPFDRTEIALQCRLLPENFISPFGSVFGDNADDAQNESGLYLGLRQRLDDEFTVQGYVDISKREEEEYDALYAPTTQDYRLTLDLTSRTKLLSVELDSRLRTREDVARDSQNATYLNSGTKLSERLIVSYSITPELLLRGRVGYIHYDERDISDDGIAVGIQVRYYPLLTLMVETGIGYFSTDSYDSRVYLNESELPGAVSLTSLYGKGSRYYILSRFTPTQEVTLGVKVSGSIYDYHSEHLTTMLISGQIDLRF